MVAASRRIAIPRGVGKACVRNDAISFQITPCAGETSTGASIVTRVTAHHVLGRQHGRCRALRNSHTIAQHLRSGKCPTTPALLLIADWVSQTSPMRCGIEGSWNGLGKDSRIHTLIQDLVKVVGDVREISAQENPSIIKREAVEKRVCTSFPRRARDGIEAPNVLGVVDERLSGDMLP